MRSIQGRKGAHLRSGAVLVPLVVIGIAATGCGSSGGNELSSMTSNVRPEDPAPELGDIGESLEGFGQDVEEFFGDLLEGLDPGSSGEGGNPGDSGNSGEGGGQGQGKAEGEGGGEAAPGPGSRSAECSDLLINYSNLYLSALSGATPKEIKDLASELRKSLPKDLHDDLEIVVSVATDLANGGLAGGGNLGSPGYSQADKAITDYLVDGCASESID
jgi:hypothetical protein